MPSSSSPSTSDILQRLCSFFHSRKLALSSASDDGRVNSSKNEKEVLQRLQDSVAADKWFHLHGLKLVEPSKRDWFDFAIESEPNGTAPSVFIPVNIKVSTLSGADNLNCKLGLYFALTGKKPSFGNGIGWEQFFEYLHDGLPAEPVAQTDYFFMVFEKANPCNCFVVGLSQLAVLQSNNSNLPFQACWEKNTAPVSPPRDPQQIRQFLLGGLWRSLSTRIRATEKFRQLFPEIAGGSL